ncbi:MAG: hypothetical protein IKH26_13285 [Bacteroidaceae bacterium]|nr:hypothetical protein [Bacteroidaceae bacterium]
MKKILFVIPRAGLCNRMRVISSAAFLANRYNMRMVVLWVRNKELNAKFSDLFEPLPYHVLEFSGNDSIAYKACYRMIQSLHPVYMISNVYFHNDSKDKIDYFERLKGNHGLLDTYHGVVDSVGYSMFKVKKHLQPLLYPLDDLRQVCGIHIRRTDNERSIQNSPTYLFIEKMEEEIRQNPSVKFYLATDDPQEEADIKEKFGDRILVYPKRRNDRITKTGMEDAVVDLANLSHCKKLYASSYSTFSLTAAEWHGIDYIVLSK